MAIRISKQTILTLGRPACGMDTNHYRNTRCSLGTRRCGAGYTCIHMWLHQSEKSWPRATTKLLLKDSNSESISKSLPWSHQFLLYRLRNSCLGSPLIAEWIIESISCIDTEMRRSGRPVGKETVGKFDERVVSFTLDEVQRHAAPTGIYSFWLCTCIPNHTFGWTGSQVVTWHFF